MKLTVTYTYPNNAGKRDAMLFDEALVRMACKLNKCDAELMEGCMENMQAGLNDCISCYCALIIDLDAEPEYKKEI